MASYDDTATVSGSVVSIENGADEVGAKSCVVTVRPTLAGTSEVVEKQTGRNLSSVSEYQNNPWSFWGTNFVDMRSVLNTLPIGTYALSYTFEIVEAPDTSNISYGKPYIRALVNGNYVSLTSYSISNASGVSVGDKFTVSASFTINAETVGKIENVYLYCDKKESHSGTGRGNYNLVNAMLEIGSTAHAYEPYTTPTQYTANLGRTIYGGTADVVKGTGSEKYKLYTASDVTSLYWNAKKAEQVDTNHRASFRIALSSGYITVNNSLCNELSYSTNIASGSGAYEGYQLIATAGIYFCIDLADIGMENATSSTPDEDFLDAIRNYGDNLKFVVELATPTDFTFTPITPTPETVGKVNNVYCDTGNTELTYHDNAHGFASVTVTKQAPDQADEVKTAYLHKVIYGGQADVVKGKAEPRNLIQLYTRDSNNGIDYSINPDGSLHREGLATANSFNNASASNYANCPFKLPKGKYTFSIDGEDLDSNTYTVIGGWTQSGTRIANQGKTATGTITFTVDEDFGLWFYVKLNSGTEVDDDVYIWLEEGSDSHAYAPYFEPFSFPPISIGTDDGENNLFAIQGDSAITYRKAVD